MRKFKGFFILLLISLLLFGACVKQTANPFLALANKGMLPLSTHNAFLGPNIFLSKELEKSSYLFRFFEAKGAPMAIEISENQVDPPRMYLFYPKDQEVYVGELMMTKYRRQWVVRGPYSINREDFRDLKRMQVAFNGEPLFHIYNNPYRFKFHQTRRVAKNVEPTIPLIPTPTPTPKKIVKKKKKEKDSPLKPTVPDVDLDNPENFKALNTDQQAIAMSQGYAERADNGDVIHTVKYENANLEDITEWYTGSKEHLDLISRINNLKADQNLVQGTRIRIPLKLLKRVKVMLPKH